MKLTESKIHRLRGFANLIRTRPGAAGWKASISCRQCRYNNEEGQYLLLAKKGGTAEYLRPFV